jgi:hypothetical protein
MLDARYWIFGKDVSNMIWERKMPQKRAMQLQIANVSCCFGFDIQAKDP